MDGLGIDYIAKTDIHLEVDAGVLQVCEKGCPDAVVLVVFGNGFAADSIGMEDKAIGLDGGFAYIAKHGRYVVKVITGFAEQINVHCRPYYGTVPRAKH